ncbi:Adhesion G protein-coupled receptor G3 [Camelus dromedarius]|uniref:Adhesion G protein-coupled receptor G3 n=1 Tax=Camelus dromedarius TaxID=9838 RepID=A0A5N4DTB8_CAMDR|nr:Adhesion G protein-coupled receptor G3 [Camelus dromedarius]
MLLSPAILPLLLFSLVVGVQLLLSLAPSTSGHGWDEARILPSSPHSPFTTQLLVPWSKKGEKEATGSSDTVEGKEGRGEEAGSAEPMTRGPHSCRASVDKLAKSRMVTPRALAILLLLHLASGEQLVPYPLLPSLGDPGTETGKACETLSCLILALCRYWLNFEIHLVEESQTETVNMSFLNALVKNISTDISEDLHFSLTPSQIPMQVTEEEHQHPDRVRLPRSLFASLQGRGPMVRLAITVLDVGSGNLFKGPRINLEDGSRVLNSRLVGLSLGHIPVAGLADPLEITFSHQHQPPAGCGTSMIFLAFTIVLYAFLRFSRQRFKSEDAPKIHVALSVSLFLLNLAFFINVGNGLRGSDAACWVRGAVFHYFLLCAFTWMGLETFHLYLLVIKVFNTYFGRYFLKLSFLGWGLPALIVIGTGSANSYGPYTIRDKENRTTLELCWFHEDTAISALYVTVHGYFFIIFLFSAVILALVAWKIFTLSSATAGKERGQTWKGVLTLLGLSSLTGVTWGLAILTPLGLPTTYVFALFTSLQGEAPGPGSGAISPLGSCQPRPHPSLTEPLSSLTGIFIFCWFIVLYFPSRSTTTSTSGTARVDQAHTMSQA